jgi:ABC-type nitrate/sulfonate/bicarbonate transport system permease component
MYNCNIHRIVKGDVKMSNNKTSSWVTAFFNVIIFGIIGLMLGAYIGCAIGIIIGILFAILSGVERIFNMLNEKNIS